MTESVNNDSSSCKVFGWNFRGFKEIEVPLDEAIFLVGDNSSGKSSILHLVSCITKDSLQSIPSLEDDLAVGRYDYFSPYLNHADVTLGFEVTYGEDRYAKLVTVKRVPNAPPKVISCSYLANGNIVTLRRFGDSLRHRIVKQEKGITIPAFAELHGVKTGFSLTKNKKAEQTAPNSMRAFFESGDPEEMEAMGILDAVFCTIPNSRHIAPVRGLPERFYNLKRTLTSSGKHFAVLMRDLSSREGGSGFADVEAFGRESELFESIEVEPLSKKVDEAPLIVRIKKNGKQFFLNQVGVGLSQVVPVLVESMFAITSENHIVMFQQPELHLHPVAQAALGSFFFKALYPSSSFIVETHSNFLIDRFRAEIRDKNSLEPPKARILFCRNTDSGNSCTSVGIATDGTLIDAPKDYFSFFVAELGRTMF